MKVNEKMAAGEVKITPRDEDYSQWYLDVIFGADLAEYGPTKGSMIIKPSGYALWEKIQNFLDKSFKDMSVQNVYFPMLIPERLLKKEENHVEGFSPEVAVVTYAGGEKLEEALIVRPTSETIMYETFSRWIQSHRDLPLLINQWVNVVRWELRPRLFLRTTEFLWQEGHTAHSNHEEADLFARKILDLYATFAKDIMAIPVILGIKTENEKFAGASKTYCVEAMMQDGKALQFATSHNLGQNFAKAFNIQFTNENNQGSFVWQTSWGLSTRTIGGLIMVHSDDKGLVLPPNIAPIKIVIIPIWNSEESKNLVLKHALGLHDELISEYGNTVVIIDDRDMRSGQKHYQWEKKGIPVRIEIGPRDISGGTVVAVRRDTSKKIVLPALELSRSLRELFTDIQNSLYSKALALRDLKTVDVENWNDFLENIEAGNFIQAYWDGSSETEKKIKEETKATIRCIPFTLEKVPEGKCIYSGNPTAIKVIFARSY
ncbi:MAG: Proline-tRNA ligase [Parcubacteria group bacterium GW2011_GWA1_47_10]|nr:MAG: Proline-tRNA ligase [Parcubacteria group bacterium GW2011_GWA1_47_10]